tara:strand:+ start:73479 stop:73730 length:252 start_codon:yes stop_codon:yes gene_type:complete
MSNRWQLQEAKNRFSHVVNEAVLHGPQIVTRHGEDTVVVVSMKQYQQETQPHKSLYAILASYPGDFALDVTRDKTTNMRDVDL